MAEVHDILRQAALEPLLPGPEPGLHSTFIDRDTDTGRREERLS